ncbi:CLUMA_CG003268, isoform A [Clunio marinus]|uniref:CLUMA_CG003268, isoform A n=1 Tax=Clunio marinus TaxID=568069 RepID=A0A1J1HNH5_9DIPT|nr:CLUMA_CG003268, isoform A [Clunio marinus]
MTTKKYILVGGKYGKPIGLPLEEDGTLLLTTIQSIFPDAIGLIFNDPEGRGVFASRFDGSRFHPGGWYNDVIYYCAMPRCSSSSSSNIEMILKCMEIK